MRKRFAAALITSAACGAFAVSASASQLIYEPFDQTPGDLVVGSVNTSTGNVWNECGSLTPPANSIVSGSLTAPAGYPASTGNSAKLYSATGGLSGSIEQNRLDIPNAFNADSTPKYGLGSTLYYSCLLQISDLSGLTVPNTNLNANNDGLIAFSNQQGSQTGRATIWAGSLVIRLGSTAGTFNLGVRASNTPGGTNPGHTYWSGDLTPSTDPHLIVVSFARGSGAYGDKTNGTNSLWVDPSSTTYGDLTAPTADGSSQGVMGGAGADLFGTEALFINNNIGGPGTAPTSYGMDEIRVGETWRDVTSIPEPASLSLLALGGIGLLSRRRRRRK